MGRNSGGGGRSPRSEGLRYARSAQGKNDPVVKGGRGVDAGKTAVTSRARELLRGSGLNRYTGKTTPNERKRRVDEFVRQESYKAGLAAAAGKPNLSARQIRQIAEDAAGRG